MLDYHHQLEASDGALQRAEEQRRALENTLSGQPKAEEQPGTENVEEMRRQLENSRKQLGELEARWQDLEQGRGWRLFKSIQSIRVGLFPVGSRREKILDRLITRKVK